MCSSNRGYRLAPADFINLSHGVRAENVKSGKPNSDTEPLSWRSPSHSQNDSSRPNTSAFASFNSQDAFAPAFIKGEIQTPVAPIKIMGKNNDQAKPNRQNVGQNVQNDARAPTKAQKGATQTKTNPTTNATVRTVYSLKVSRFCLLTHRVSNDNAAPHNFIK